VARHIIIGDIHGCFDELRDLLERAAVTSGDAVVAVGDLTRKGPAPDRCLELWIENGYLSVLGNNDATTIERSDHWRSRVFATLPDRMVMRRPDLIDAIAQWPLYREFPKLGVVVVHGGVLPNSSRFSPDLVPREAALGLRYIRRSGKQWTFVPKGEQQDGDRFWSEVWEGNRTVVYGHTPRREPKVDKQAIGLDTGCVYGGALTAAIFDREGDWKLVAVPARRQYAR